MYSNSIQLSTTRYSVNKKNPARSKDTNVYSSTHACTCTHPGTHVTWSTALCRAVVVYHFRTKFTKAEIANFVKSWQNSKAVMRNFIPVLFTVQLRHNDFWTKLRSPLAKFCIMQAVPVLVVLFFHYRPRLLFANFGNTKKSTVEPWSY